MILKVLIDWPDFYSEFAYALCEEVPEKFIQVRNIILAAIPKRMSQLKDPFYV